MPWWRVRSWGRDMDALTRLHKGLLALDTGDSDNPQPEPLSAPALLAWGPEADDMTAARYLDLAGMPSRDELLQQDAASRTQQATQTYETAITALDAEEKALWGRWETLGQKVFEPA